MIMVVTAGTEDFILVEMLHVAAPTNTNCGIICLNT